jgi:hypothetical protein
MKIQKCRENAGKITIRTTKVEETARGDQEESEKAR